MGIFSSPNPFDPLVEKATDEKNTSEDWALIMEVCDQATSQPKDILKAIARRLNNPNPIVVMQAITVLDTCVKNSGKPFHLEVCSRDFEAELRRLATKSPHPKTAEKLRLCIRRWTEEEFKRDPQLSLIPSLYHQLRKEGHSFKTTDPSLMPAGSKHRPSRAELAVREEMLKNPDYVASNDEEDQIAKAIALSLQETGQRSGAASSSTLTNGSLTRSSAMQQQQYQSQGSGASQSQSNGPLYPSFASSTTSLVNGGQATNGLSMPVAAAAAATQKEPYKVRALYDFEAAEDNELTFKAGELIIVSDDSDPNWWKGSNHRGEGLFPSNFITPNLDGDVSASEPERQLRAIEKRVSFSEDVKVKLLETTSKEEPVEIDEEKIDRMMSLIFEADPTGEKGDPEEMIQLEEMCTAMGPLIDEKLEEIDSKHAALTGVLQQLNTALAQYHELMRDSGQVPLSSHHQHPSMMPMAAANGSLPVGSFPAEPPVGYYGSPVHYPPPHSGHQMPHYSGPATSVAVPYSVAQAPGVPPDQSVAPTQVTYTHQYHPHPQQSPGHHYSQTQPPYGLSSPPPHQPQPQQQQYMGPPPPTTPPGAHSHDPSQHSQQQPYYGPPSPASQSSYQQPQPST